MRRFSGRVGAAVVLALCLSMVPVGAASASPWADFGWGAGILAKVELMVVRVWARFEASAVELEPSRPALKEGGSLDDNGST